MNRYVVSLRPTGLGDLLICLCAAWIFARNTGRTLVVDWRGSPYARDSRENIFSRCFANMDALAGVPLQIAGFGPTSLSRPAFPDHWDHPTLLAEPWRGPREDSFELRDQAVSLIRSGGDIAAPTIVLNTCINDGVTAFADAHCILSALRPRPSVEAAVDAFRTTTLEDGPFIGLHVRHGNGGNILGHGRYWEQSFSESIDRCRKAVALARRRIGADAPVFLCTDSIDVEIALRKTISRLVTRDKVFRLPGQGELHHGSKASAGLEDAFVEMLLLARSNVLIRYPPASFFTFLPAVLKPSAEPPPESLEALARPSDPDDPLSCAVLF